MKSAIMVGSNSVYVLEEQVVSGVGGSARMKER